MYDRSTACLCFVWNAVISIYLYIAVGSFEINGGFYGTGNNPVVRQVYCNNDYNTPDINSCTINHQLFGSECHERQVGVLCQGMTYAIC